MPGNKFIIKPKIVVALENHNLSLQVILYFTVMYASTAIYKHYCISIKFEFVLLTKGYRSW